MSLNNSASDNLPMDSDTRSVKSRVCTTVQQLEELVMDITQSDLNRQMQQLVAEYKKTGRDEFKYNAEALMEEFDAWWDYEALTFTAPTEL